MKYIESTPLPDGTYDHTEVRAAYTGISEIVYRGGREKEYKPCPIPIWLPNLQYKVKVHDTYGIHESSSTLREVKGDAGPAVAEMLLEDIAERDNRIKELESLLGEARDTIEDILGYVVSTGSDDAVLDKIRAALNKEPK